MYGGCCALCIQCFVTEGCNNKNQLPWEVKARHYVTLVQGCYMFWIMFFFGFISFIMAAYLFSRRLNNWLHILVVQFHVGRPAVYVAVFSFCVEIRLSSARCLSLSVSSLLLPHLSPSHSLLWALVCCFSDAALTSDCSLFITSVYASPFLPFPLYSSTGQPVSQIPVVWLVKHRYYTL